MKSKYILFIVLVMTLTLPFSSCSGNGNAAPMSTAHTFCSGTSSLPDRITSSTEEGTVFSDTGISAAEMTNTAAQTVTVTSPKNEEVCTASQTQEAKIKTSTVPQKSTGKVTFFTLGTTTESKAPANTTLEQKTTAVTTVHDLTDARTTTNTKQNFSALSSAPLVTSAAAETKKAESVTVTVSCRAAVEYAKSNPEKTVIIPANDNGIVISSPVYVSTGDSAMTALKKALSENRLTISESRGYIKGIGGLNEKACGGSSGWMYSVNGESPMAASDKYSVSPGDKIIFYYVTNYGDSP